MKGKTKNTDMHLLTGNHECIKRKQKNQKSYFDEGITRMSKRISFLAIVLFGIVICAGCFQEVNLLEGSWRPGYRAYLIIEEKRTGKLYVTIDGEAVEWDRNGFYEQYDSPD